MPRPATGTFTPNTAGTVTVAVTTTSGSTRVALVGGGTDLLITSEPGSATAFVTLGTATSTAAVASAFAVPGGAVYTLGRPEGCTHVVGITSAGTATLYVTTGEGG